VLLVGLAIGGCANQEPRSFKVAPISTGREKLALDPPDIVRAMRRAGFSDQQIVKHGPRLRNALAMQGAARIKAGEMTQAMFMIRDEEVYGVALNQGAFRYKPDEAPDELSDNLDKPWSAGEGDGA
jgi:hypothetical protein